MALNVLEPNPAEDSDEKADRRQICCDVLYPVSSQVIDLPAGSAQGDAVQDGVLLLWLRSSNLEYLGSWRAR